MTLRHVVNVIGAMATCCASWSCAKHEVKPTANVEESEEVIRGAGATFPAALYEKWVEEYRAIRPDVAIKYDAVGSGEGTARFIAEHVDFGASDAAMTDEEISRVKRGVTLVPATAGSIVLAYNLPDLAGDLKLSRQAYVDIFLGKITEWTDTRLRRDNPNLSFPDLSITVVARRDSSGTTFAFTNHLNAVSDEWRDRGLGPGKVVDWPGSAMLAYGNEGVAAIVKRSPGTIGYVEYGIAKRAGLKMAWLENKAGSFIRPTATSGMATLANAELPENLRAFFPDPPGADSYPIVTFSWLLLYQKYDDAQRGEQLREFVQWSLQDGQTFSEPLGYIPLAPEVAARALQAVSEVQ